MTELKGICTPVCTVFNEDESAVDEARYRKHIDRVLDAGVHIITPGGGTGEFSFLTTQERKQVLEIACDQNAGRARVIAHVSAIRTEDTIALARHAESLGVSAMLVLPPYFEGPTLEGVYEHYERVSAEVSTPIMAYNIPVHSGIDLDVDFVCRIMALPNIDYLKDSMGDFIRIQDLTSRGVKVFVGGEPIMFHGLLAGARGCFWGTSNALPKDSVDLFNLVEENRLEEAIKCWHRMYPLNRFVWGHAFNPGVKAAVNLLGGDVGVCRRPVQPLSPEEHRDLESIISAL